MYSKIVYQKQLRITSCRQWLHLHAVKKIYLFFQAMNYILELCLSARIHISFRVVFHFYYLNSIQYLLILIYFIYPIIFWVCIFVCVFLCPLSSCRIRLNRFWGVLSLSVKDFLTTISLSMQWYKIMFHYHINGFRYPYCIMSRDCRNLTTCNNYCQIACC